MAEYEYIERERLLHRFNIDDMMNVNGTLVSLNDARNIISGFPAADVAPVGWISVKDRLPEPEQEVLVIAHGWSDRLLYIGSYQRMEAERSWLTGVTSKASDWSLWGWSYLKEPEVTHWMPLPDPPKDTETACRRKECGT